MSRVISLVLGALLAFVSLRAEAITLAKLPFSDLVAQSSVIVYGRVSEVHGRWTDDRHGIESLVTLEALEYLKGRYGETVMFRTPGGQVGDTVNVWPGAPSFRTGDYVVLFLAARGPTIPSIVGLTQGVLRVSSDPRSGELLARPRPLGVASPLAGDAAPPSTIQLTQLAAQVRAAVESGR